MMDIDWQLCRVTDYVIYTPNGWQTCVLRREKKKSIEIQAMGVGSHCMILNLSQLLDIFESHLVVSLKQS